MAGLNWHLSALSAENREINCSLFITIFNLEI